MIFKPEVSVYVGPPSIPIIGSLFWVWTYLQSLKFHHLVWDYCAKLYGPIVGIKLFNDYVVLVSGKELIKKLCNQQELNGRPDTFFFRIRSMGKRFGIVFTDGPLWINQRRFSMKTLKSLGLGRLSQLVELEGTELVRSLMMKNGKRTFIQNDDTNIFDVSVLNVTWTILRGQRFELEDEKLTKLMEMVVPENSLENEMFNFFGISSGS